MMGENNKVDVNGLESGNELLKQLFHLKRYETPEIARMTRNKQNIMRQVREISRNKRKNLGDLLEINFPWLFAEPRYGVAMLFLAFAGLQYLGINARHAAQSNAGIYTTSTDRFAAYEQAAPAATNSLDYAEVTPGLRLLPNPQSSRVEWVNRWQKK